ncbi:SDR family oxidoreductase [Falsibacillus pallidus]|uniref:3-oxoacyl-[acyl-carrier protein] reductase n=1 Tax=Falsibacillus pallidus TaxID=493781 RepID=A0A370GHM8_9BACI|nr:SDR family oxidoreductase [Falsibacillus pallidus]RDI43157.1 3-oxoacyl-[acyl-carrier protein] reductase [Falsibacillus pallidus]
MKSEWGNLMKIYGDRALNQMAIVTGATRMVGIGAAICLALADKGFDILYTYWPSYDRIHHDEYSQNEHEKLLELLLEKGVKAEGIEIDLSCRDAYKDIMDRANQFESKLCVLVNNAAYSTRSNYEELDAEELDRHYFVNIRNTALLSSEFCKNISFGVRGKIINMTSGQSLGAMPGELAYAASKGAVEAFTKTLAAEAAPKGITVNAVNPGPTDTGWMTEEIKRELNGRFPFGRPGQPMDAARLVAFLASPEAEWITGQVIHSEGGFLR